MNSNRLKYHFIHWFHSYSYSSTLINHYHYHYLTLVIHSSITNQLFIMNLICNENMFIIIMTWRLCIKQSSAISESQSQQAHQRSISANEFNDASALMHRFRALIGMLTSFKRRAIVILCCSRRIFSFAMAPLIEINEVMYLGTRCIKFHAFSLS